jgi:hypothetical protein
VRDFSTSFPSGVAMFFPPFLSLAFLGVTDPQSQPLAGQAQDLGCHLWHIHPGHSQLFGEVCDPQSLPAKVVPKGLSSPGTPLKTGCPRRGPTEESKAKQWRWTES